MRLQDEFTVDKYRFDSKLFFEAFKFFDLAAAYRNRTNVKTKTNVSTDCCVFDATLKNQFGRFTPLLQTRITNYSDTKEDEKITFIQPCVKVVYDIKGI